MNSVKSTNTLPPEEDNTLSEKLKQMEYINVQNMDDVAAFVSDETLTKLIEIDAEIATQVLHGITEQNNRWAEMEDRSARYMEHLRKKLALKKAKKAAKEAEDKIKAAREELGSDYDEYDESDEE